MIYMYIYFLLMISLMAFFLAMMFSYLKLSLFFHWMFFSLNSMIMEFIVLLDWVSLIFLSLVTLISSFVLFYSVGYMEGDLTLKRFFYLILLFVFSMILMIMSPNMMSILIGWDGLGLVSYGLIIYYQNWKSFNSGMVTILLNRIGDVGILMMISLLMIKGSWNMLFYSQEMYLVILMLIISASTKSAQLPFSIWLPLAMAAPTPVSSLVHSSTLVTAGVYLLIRFNMFLFDEAKSYLLMVSSMTMFLAGFVANFENDLKKIIALSTLSQLGLMMSILSLGEVEMGFFHLVMHALFKSLLFMCGGLVIHMMFNNQDIRCMGNLIKFYPLLSVIFLYSSLSLCGLPFLSGFYSKDLIMESFLMSKMNMFSIMIIFVSTLFTVSYSVRLLYFVYLNKFVKFNSFFLFFEDKLMILSMMVLFMFSIVGGCMFINMFFFIEKMIILKFLEKNLIYLIIIMGVYFGGWISFLPMNLNSSMKILFTKMLGLNLIFSDIYYKPNKYSLIFNKMDSVTLEFIQVHQTKFVFIEVLKFFYSQWFGFKWSSLFTVIFFFIPLMCLYGYVFLDL
uniref:NADH-ubiquinone oxidoreductase chain 5 n=1 Tax=Orancistrocerus aterrimus TaxID=2485977 RepID=A0A3G3FWI4_9HYME|nr:NADH dehydrogenase subunit 5 [Orancistrocerus aterrimus]AYQ18926.1 NADH dehydrogenase subunit 5 [Orancistrocerus aterrimus]